MPDLSRELSIFADGEPITGFSHARLTGRDFIGLYPMPFTLRLWNLSEQERVFLSAARELSVLHAGSALASGTVCDVCRRTVPVNC